MVNSLSNLSRQTSPMLNSLTADLLSEFDGTLAAFVSTMTVFFHLDLSRIPHEKVDVRRVTECFTEQPLTWKRCIEDIGPYGVRVNGSTKKGTNVNFGNSVSVINTNLAKGSRVCAKIFRNGGVQVTGSRSEEQAVMVSLHMARLIHRLYDATLTSHGEELSKIVLDKSVQMINIVCNIKAVLSGRIMDLTKMGRLLQAAGIRSTYDRDTYCGINIKIPLNDHVTPLPDGKKLTAIALKNLNPEATILFFVSGSFIITGVKSVKDVDVVRHKFVRFLYGQLKTLMV